MVVNPVNVVNPPTTEPGPEGPQGPPGPTIYPPTGLAVSTGTAWGVSIPAADVALLNAANSFTTDQSINGNLGITGNATFNGLVKTFAVVAPSGNIEIDSVGTGNLLLNWSGGSTGSVIFGNGSSVQVASVDDAGNAHFNGTVTSGAVNVTQLLSALQARIAALEAKLG